MVHFKGQGIFSQTVLVHSQLINLGEQQIFFCDVIGQFSEVLRSRTHGCATRVWFDFCFTALQHI